MPKRYKGRHRRPTRTLTVAALVRPAVALSAAAAASLTMIAPAQAHTGDHTVRPGDTLSGLAASHGLSWRTVYDANRGTIGGNPNLLRVGQRLSIGGSTSAPSSPSPSSPKPTGQYVVRAGDTLGAIAARHGTTWQRLHAANRSVIGANPNLLRIGQRLVISGAPAGPAAARATTPERASRTYERPARVNAAYGMWDPHVRPVVQQVAERFGVRTVLTRPGHSPTQGRAADFMVYDDRAKGDAVTRYVIANAARFGVEYVIWRQRIYIVSSGTWQTMANRGSPTANHMDHPHVAFR